MRTALLTWDYPPVPTGLGQAACEIAHGLASQGCKVTVFTPDREGRSHDDRTGITTFGCRSDDGGWLRTKACVGHLAAPRLFKAAVEAEAERNGPFDLIEATNWYAPAALLAATSVPLVVRNSTPAIDAFDSEASLRDRTDLRFAHYLEGRTARRADALISNTEHHGGTIGRLYRLSGDQPHSIIPLSLEADFIRRGREAPTPDFAGPLRIVFIGRAERRKGFDEMLQGFFSYYETEPEGRKPRLTLIGLAQGSLQERMRSLGLGGPASEAITDLGRAEESEKEQALAQANVVLAPSRYESYGIVYREAAAFGRPLIACADDPSAAELLSAVPMGILAERCSGSAIAAALANLAADRGGMEAMRKAGLAHARTLRRERLGRETLDVYERVLARRASAA